MTVIVDGGADVVFPTIQSMLGGLSEALPDENPELHNWAAGEYRDPGDSGVFIPNPSEN